MSRQRRLKEGNEIISSDFTIGNRGESERTGLEVTCCLTDPVKSTSTLELLDKVLVTVGNEEGIEES